MYFVVLTSFGYYCHDLVQCIMFTRCPAWSVVWKHSTKFWRDVKSVIWIYKKQHYKQM